MNCRLGYLVDDLKSRLAVSRYDAVLYHSMRRGLQHIRVDGDLILPVDEEQLFGRLEFNALVGLRYEEQIQYQVILARRCGVLPDRRCTAQPQHVQREGVGILEA